MKRLHNAMRASLIFHASRSLSTYSAFDTMRPARALQVAPAVTVARATHSACWWRWRTGIPAAVGRGENGDRGEDKDLVPNTLRTAHPGVTPPPGSPFTAHTLFVIFFTHDRYHMIVPRVNPCRSRRGVCSMLRTVSEQSLQPTRRDCNL